MTGATNNRREAAALVKESGGTRHIRADSSRQ